MNEKEYISYGLKLNTRFNYPKQLKRKNPFYFKRRVKKYKNENYERFRERAWRKTGRRIGLSRR